MAYQPITAKVRKDPFGFGLWNRLRTNLLDAQSLEKVEHNLDGTHNSLEVARAVGSVVWGGATYTLSGFNAFVSSVASAGAGIITLTLGAGKFSTNMVPMVTAQGVNGESLPIIASARVISATSVEVYVRQLAALAGNTWNLADGTVAVALHASPYTAGGLSAITSPLSKMRGQCVSAEAADWNTFVTGEATLRANQLVGHRSGGTHNIREMARAYAALKWDGANYSITSSSAGGVTAVSRVGAGIVDLTLTGAGAFALPMQVFGEVDYARNNGGSFGDLYVIDFPTSQMTATNVRAYIYKHDFAANNWARADTNFYAAVHTAAV